MQAVCCPTCDARLFPSELRDGWCDTCGKKVPAGLLRARRPERASSAPPAQASDVATWKLILGVAVMVFALLVLVGSAAAGDSRSIGKLGALAGLFVGGLIFRGIRALVRGSQGGSD